MALRYYRRLLQMGANSPEVWQNLGLCCFYAAQYDMALKCFESALAAASDDTAADVWWVERASARKVLAALNEVCGEMRKGYVAGRSAFTW